ncbi:MAG: glycosyltransferase family 39 protein [Rhodomicrobium sp.]|nr:glycosyltransferase family 39 protein [Rhodomicrobium sp.]
MSSRRPKGGPSSGLGGAFKEVKKRWLDAALAALLAAAAVHAVGFSFSLAWSVRSQIFFSFRQTQTAISAYWMLQGGPLVTYETPVLGAPWAIPFEFPLFQWMAAALASLGVPLDAAGRLVSFSFFFLCLLPARWIFKELGFDRATFTAFAIMFLFSPLYVFYGRAFMIESTALFLGAAWLAFMLRYCRRGGRLTLACAIAAGALGILVKSTTFATFGLLGAAALAALFIRRKPVLLRGGRIKVDQAILARCLAGGVACVLVLAIGLSWVRYTDQVKFENPSGFRIVSGNLKDFNYGPLDLRWSPRLWDVAILKRALPEIFGVLFPIAIVAFGAALSVRRDALYAGAALLAALAPLLLFANLHRVHDYYQYANGAFAIAAVALGVGALFSVRQRALGFLLLAGVVVSQLLQFNQQYRPAIVADGTGGSRYRAALAAREATDSNEGLLVLGTIGLRKCRTTREGAALRSRDGEARRTSGASSKRRKKPSVGLSLAQS